MVYLEYLYVGEGKEAGYITYRVGEIDIFTHFPGDCIRRVLVQST